MTLSREEKEKLVLDLVDDDTDISSAFKFDRDNPIYDTVIYSTELEIKRYLDSLEMNIWYVLILENLKTLWAAKIL